MMLDLVEDLKKFHNIELNGGNPIHKDLKLQNIIVDEQGKPRITDFGLAEIFQKGEQKAPYAFNSAPGYMHQSLDTKNSESYTRRNKLKISFSDAKNIDVYSLGILFNYMIKSSKLLSKEEKSGFENDINRIIQSDSVSCLEKSGDENLVNLTDLVKNRYIKIETAKKEQLQRLKAELIGQNAQLDGASKLKFTNNAKNIQELVKGCAIQRINIFGSETKSLKSLASLLNQEDASGKYVYNQLRTELGMKNTDKILETKQLLKQVVCSVKNQYLTPDLRMRQQQQRT